MSLVVVAARRGEELIMSLPPWPTPGRAQAHLNDQLADMPAWKAGESGDLLGHIRLLGFIITRTAPRVPCIPLSKLFQCHNF